MPPWEVVTRMEGLPIKDRMLSDMYLVVQVPGAALGGGHENGGAPHQGYDAFGHVPGRGVSLLLSA